MEPNGEHPYLLCLSCKSEKEFGADVLLSVLVKYYMDLTQFLFSSKYFTAMSWSLSFSLS